MRVDSYGCIVMENDGLPGDVGDSCAETGRYCILKGRIPDNINLGSFFTPTGFIRHPLSPWREDDFTADQAKYLLMAAQLCDPVLALLIKVKMLREGRARLWTPEMIMLRFEWLQLFALSNVIQIAINKFPWRWHDGGEYDATWSWFRRTFWRWTKSDTATIPYVTVFVAMVYLSDLGIRWPLQFLDVPKYRARAKAYYANQKNSEWFAGLFDINL